MNTSCRVPGITRNSGWRSVDAEIGAHRLDRPQLEPTRGAAPWSGFELVAESEFSGQLGRVPVDPAG